MKYPNASTAVGSSIVRGLVSKGVGLFVASPGSRSTALVSAARANPDVRLAIVLDERSACYMALGYTKSSGLPAAVICTSGTAVANCYPAVVEASMSYTPLIVVSADRPPELQGVGSNQTIAQQKIFGGFVRSFENVLPGEDRLESVELERAVRSTIDAATSSSPGPAHLNVMFREPTVPVSDDGRTQAEPVEFNLVAGRGSERVSHPALGADTTDLPSAKRGLVITGDGAYDRQAVLDRSRRLGWPVLATAESALRGNEVICSYHHLLAGGIPAALRPEMVVAIGRIGPSPRLESLLDAADTRVRVDSWGRYIDPGLNATSVLADDPARVLGQLECPEPGASDWLDSWVEADSRVAAALGEVLTGQPLPTGAGIAHSMNHVAWDRLVVASSLPIRDVDAHLNKAGKVIANRGASGIDGFVSTAIGAASVGGSTLAVAGDLSVLHDNNGFLAPAEEALTMVVVDNAGGGLFDLLPQARYAPGFESLFVTPQNRDFGKLAKFHQLDFTEVTEADGIAPAITGALSSTGRSLIRIVVDRRVDLEMRAALDDAARRVLN